MTGEQQLAVQARVSFVYLFFISDLSGRSPEDFLFQFRQLE